MFDCFITEEESRANFAALGDMFDQRYRDRELPDDLFAEHFPPGVTQEEDYYINKDYMVIDDHEMSRVERVVMSDDVDEEFTIEVGPKDMDNPHIYIEPDYIPGLVALKWYMEFMMSSIPLMLPYIEVARMNVPTQAEEVGPIVQVFDNFFSEREGLIFGPTYQFTIVNPAKKYVVADIEEDAIIMMNTKMQKYGYKFVFSTKYPFREATLNHPYKFVWLQFNPFHPLAPSMIQSYVIIGTVVKGTYRMGRKVKDFFFDMSSTMYRIHSEHWRNVLPAHKHMMVFDIVSNCDIVGMIPELYGASQRLTKYEGKYVQAYQLSDNSIAAPYSPMMKPRGVEEGCEFKYYSYYSSYPVNIYSSTVLCYDVSHLFSLVFCYVYDYDVRVERNSDKMVIARIRSHTSKRVIEHGYYLYFTKKGHLEVFYEGDNDLYAGCVKVKKNILEDVFYSNMPTGNKGTLVNPLGVVDYDTFFRESRKFNMSYLDSMPAVNDSMFDDVFEEDLTDVKPSVLDIVDIVEDELPNEYDKTYENIQKVKNLARLRKQCHDKKLSSWSRLVDEDDGELDVPTIAKVEKITPGMLLPDAEIANSPINQVRRRNQGNGRPSQDSRSAQQQANVRQHVKKSVQASALRKVKKKSD